MQTLKNKPTPKCYYNVKQDKNYINIILIEMRTITLRCKNILKLGLNYDHLSDPSRI